MGKVGIFQIKATGLHLSIDAAFSISQDPVILRSCCKKVDFLSYVLVRLAISFAS